MTALNTIEAIERFKDNEQRMRQFVNNFGYYTADDGKRIETIPQFMKRKEGEINSGIGSMAQQRFIADVDFTPGVTVQLTLDVAPYSKAHTLVFFDVGYQHLTEWDIDGKFINFVDPIPKGVKAIQILSATPVSVGTPSNGTVDDAKLKSGSKLQLRTLEHVNVLDPGFGVPDDEVSDAYAGLQAVLDYVKSKGGGRVYVPNLTYVLSAPLKYDADNLEIICEPGASFKPANCDGLQFGNLSSTTYTDNRRSNITLWNLYVDMSNATGYRGMAFYAIDELKLNNTQTARGKKGVHLVYSYNATLINCINILSNGEALDLDGACDKTTIIRGQYGNSERGIVIRGGKAITILGASVERNNFEGIQAISGMRETAREWCDAITLIGNYIERNCQTGGTAFVSIGEGTDAPDYSKAHFIAGNYFNFDAENPANSAQVPFFAMGKVSETTVNGNRYVNSTNYIKLLPTAYKARLYLNDLTGEQAAMIVPRMELSCMIFPLENQIPLDANGTGSYTLDLSPYYTFVQSWPSFTLADTGTNAHFTWTRTNPMVYSLKVRNGPPNGSATFSGVLIGRMQ